MVIKSYFVFIFLISLLVYNSFGLKCEMVSATSQPQVPNPTNIPHPVINCRSWENVCKVEHFLDATNGNAFIQSGCAMAPIGLVTLSPKCNYNDVYGNWECYCATDVCNPWIFSRQQNMNNINNNYILPH